MDEQQRCYWLEPPCPDAATDVLIVTGVPGVAIEVELRFCRRHMLLVDPGYDEE